MKLEWLDDLLAVIETGSLSEAARQRFLTQPAFSRRIRSIESAIGAELFDRSRKPIRLYAHVIEQEPKLRELAQSLRDLKSTLGRSSRQPAELVLACQHAISTTVAPQLVQSITDEMSVRVRLRSANRDECHAMLLTRKADIALVFQLQDELPSQQDQFVVNKHLAKEPLVPVVASHQAKAFNRELAAGTLRIVAYPSDVFLGPVIMRELHTSVDASVNVQWVAETALTTAALQFAIAGLGLAWVPLSLACDAIERGELVRVDPAISATTMSIVALRLNRESSATVNAAWHRINQSLDKSVVQ